MRYCNISNSTILKKSVLQTKETELEKVVEHIQKGESYIQTEEQWLNTHLDEAQLYRNALWLEQLTTDQQLLNEKTNCLQANRRTPYTTTL